MKRTIARTVTASALVGTLAAGMVGLAAAPAAAHTRMCSHDITGHAHFDGIRKITHVAYTGSYDGLSAGPPFRRVHIHKITVARIGKGYELIRHECPRHRR